MPAATKPEPASDAAVLDLLRAGGELSIGQLARATGVTATAVRQRLNRLIGLRLVERAVVRSGRGRPGHRYSLTDKGRRQGGNNFGDLAMALWDEMKSVPDPEVRKGLLQRLAKRLATVYAGEIRGTTAAQRMESLRELFADRNVPLQVHTANVDGAELPVLTAAACPYPDLAEHDRSVCAMERMLFSELLGEGLRLSECRLDGARCCTFQTS